MKATERRTHIRAEHHAGTEEGGRPGTAIEGTAMLTSSPEHMELERHHRQKVTMDTEEPALTRTHEQRGRSVLRHPFAHRPGNMWSLQCVHPLASHWNSRPSQ